MNSSNSHDTADDDEDRDAGVLSDVLDELDRERIRRAELEAEIRKLQEDNNNLRITNDKQKELMKSTTNDSNVISQRAFVAMETQVLGYQQLVDAITLGKPAIAAAAAEEEAILAKKKLMTTKTSTTSAMTPLHQRFGLPLMDQQPKGGDTNNNESLHMKRKTLPVHIVRLLEVLPWDVKTQQHIFAVEEIYEWQTYCNIDATTTNNNSNNNKMTTGAGGSWQSQLQYFPNFFKTLPHIKKAESSTTGVTAATTNNFVGDDLHYETITHSSGIEDTTNNKKDNRNFLQFLAGADMNRKQSKSRIFTDARVTVIYDLDAGYPLPNNDGGIWEWVGSWRISSRTATGSITESLDNHERVDSDQQGWSYVIEPRDFLLGLKDMIWDNSGANETNNNIPTRLFRRRRWARQRVLVDYLSASESTKQYLKLLAENARLSLSAAKISEQLIETKLLLTETEEKLAHANDMLYQKEKSNDQTISSLKNDGQTNNLNALEPETNL